MVHLLMNWRIEAYFAAQFSKGRGASEVSDVIVACVESQIPIALCALRVRGRCDPMDVGRDQLFEPISVPEIASL